MTGKFTVPRYVDFDLGGRQFVMKPGASLTGLEAQVIGLGYNAKRTAPFTIKNAASIHLEKGSKLDSPVQALGNLEYYQCQPRTGIVGATDSFIHSGTLGVFEAGGTHELMWAWSHDLYPSEAPSLASWGLEICSSSVGCTRYMSTDVPKAITALPSPYGGYSGIVVSSLSLPPIPDVIRVRVIDLAGTAPPYSPYDPSHGYASTFILDESYRMTQRGAWCTSEGSEDFHWSEIRDRSDFYGITLQSTGPCTIDGKLAANPVPKGTYPARVVVECDGVAVGASARIEAKKSGAVAVDGGAGGVSITKGAKLDVRGTKGLRGGELTVQATGACDLGGQLLATSPVELYIEDWYGGGGHIDVTCGSVSVLPKAKLISGLHGGAQYSRLRISATDGTFHLGQGALLSANGTDSPSEGLVVTAKERCTVEGRAQSRAYFPQSPKPMTFVCGGVDLAPEATLDAGGSYGGAIIIDTTGSTTGDPPADCLIDGRLLANGVELGGSVQLDCGTDCLLSGKIQANGGEFGGHVRLDCGTTLNVDPGAEVAAKGSGPAIYNSSLVDMLAAGDVTIGGTVTADSQRDWDGGTVNIEGCNVTVTEEGRVTTRSGWRGKNTLKAHHTLRIDGPVATTLDEGTNSLVYRNAVSILKPSLIVPATTPVQDLGLSPCL